MDPMSKSDVGGNSAEIETESNASSLEAGPSSSAAAIQLQTKPTYISGWLERRTGTGIGKRWKRRFFVIEPHALVEYRDTTGASSKLFNFQEINDILTEDRDRFTFGFRFGAARWITLRASSAEDLDDWVSALRRAVINQAPPTPATSIIKKKSPQMPYPGEKRPSSLSNATTTPAAVSNAAAEEAATDLLQRREKDPIPKLSIIVNDSTKARSDQPDSTRRVAIGGSGEPRSPVRKDSMLGSVPQSSPTNRSMSLEEATSEEESSSNSEDEDYDFSRKTASAKPRSWGTSLRNFFSGTSSRGSGMGSLDEGHDESDEEDGSNNKGDGGGSGKEKPGSLDIRTIQVVETDLVEIFENQRWFPVRGWGTDRLPHDRGSWTNRSGHNRTEWHRSSLEDTSNVTANTATLGVEDREEIPGGQVHVIKDPWQWDGPWRLAPLSALNPTQGHPHPVTYSGKADLPQGSSRLVKAAEDSFREGLKKELRTNSIDSQADGPDKIGLSFGTVGEEPMPLPPTPQPQAQQRPQSHGGTSSSQAPGSAKNAVSVVRSLTKRFISSTKHSESSETSNQSNQTGGQQTLGNFHSSSEQQLHQIGGSDSSTHTNHGHHPDGWAHGFDFPDFDACIARGVPRYHPPFANNNVRTRRWVRIRRRTVNITARLPDNVLPIITPVLSFQRQVVAEGWLGVKGRAPGHWRSKYYKLVRLCPGIWDNGQGAGLVDSLPTAYMLYACECKELHQSSFKTLRLEPTSSARANPIVIPNSGSGAMVMPLLQSAESTPHLPHPTPVSQVVDGSNPLSPVHSSIGSTVLKCNNFSLLDHSDALDDEASARIIKPREIAEEPPRSGRFELVLNKDHVFLLNADTREDALAWVQAINNAAQELQRAASELGASSSPQNESIVPVGTYLNGEANQNQGKLVATKGLKKPGLLRNPFNKKKHVKAGEEDEDGEKEDGPAVQLEDTGEDPVLAPEPPTMTSESDAKIKEVIDVKLNMSLRTFFQTFVGEKARFSISDFHNEAGDSEVKCSSWGETPPGGRQGRDEFDLDGYDVVPERLLTFVTPTGAPIGPSKTRVEKRQRYYYFGASKLLVVKTWARSLDVPYGDTFLVMEKWIVTVDKEDDNQVQVKVLSGPYFTKNPFIKGTIQKSVESGGVKVYAAWKKKFLQYGGSKKTQAGGGGEDEASAESDAGQQTSMVSRIGGAIKKTGDILAPIVQASSKGALVVFTLWYLMQFLWVLERIASALERHDSESRMTLVKLVKGETNPMDGLLQ